MNQKNEINYLYFSFFFLFLSALSVLHLHTFTKASLFFLLVGFGQALFEVFTSIFIAALLKRYASKWAYSAFISLSFMLLLLHFTNFTMVRIMDATAIYIFKFFFGSGIDHLVAGFQSLNMNATMICITAASFILVPLSGLWFYSLTKWLCKKKPLFLSFRQILFFLSLSFSTLFLTNLASFPFLSWSTYAKYQKTLPFGRIFLTPSPRHLDLSGSFLPPRKETEIKLPERILKEKPNIYFFVIETLRRDFITPKIAPHLTQFGKEHIQFAHSYANASSTHLSWFALFHADFPFYWAQMRDTWQEGSIPLRMLKKMGYQIHVKSSADLKYFNMDQLIFGAKRKLADSIEEYSVYRDKEPYERDSMVIDSLCKTLQKTAPEVAQAHLIFLDATHSEYSFPKELSPFQPVCKEVDYLTIHAKSPELEGLKNRYRNSIHYVDQLLGLFFKYLKENDLFDNSIIVITGDHGEEFFEEGALFHGTHLNHHQTSVPIFLKFPSRGWQAQTDTVTHLDLFPSILHYLMKNSDFSSLFDGESIFNLYRRPFRVAILQNGPDTPIEFLVESKELKLQARWVDPSKIDIVELHGYIEPDTLSPLLKKF